VGEEVEVAQRHPSRLAALGERVMRISSLSRGLRILILPAGCGNDGMHPTMYRLLAGRA